MVNLARTTDWLRRFNGVTAHKDLQRGVEGGRVTSEAESNITRLVERARKGDGGAADDLFLRVYDELHVMAERQMRAQEHGHSLQATALVNEVYLRVFRQEWVDREHFLAVAARAMRSVLVDHARAKRRDKRIPGEKRVPLEEMAEAFQARAGDLVALDTALEKLCAFDPQMVRLVELRFFAGLPMEEAAKVLGISPRSAFREWQTARAWLRREIVA